MSENGHRIQSWQNPINMFGELRIYVGATTENCLELRLYDMKFSKEGFASQEGRWVPYGRTRERENRGRRGRNSKEKNKRSRINNLIKATKL